MPWLRNPDKHGVENSRYANVERWRDHIWQRPQVLAAFETLADQSRQSDAQSDKAWEILYGKTQSSQGGASD